MWSNLPFDLLANIFSFLSPDSLARARSACRNWYTCANAYPLPSILHRHPPWFVALPTRNRRPCCYVRNPATNRWHMLSLDFISDSIRPIASITGGLILIKVTNSTILLLAICNPFTRQFKYLPLLNIARTNPAVGVVILSSNHYRIYVAGGMSDAGLGGATYEPSVEMYDSRDATWEIVGSMPVEYAVRLTVWTPNESVYSNGVVYWMTSARAYNVMGFEIGSNEWREVSVPMADRLEFAALVKREGRLTVVGGTGGEEEAACVWELKGSSNNEWCLIEKVPIELGLRLRKGKRSWGSTKCVGGDGGIWLYREKEVGSGMVVWREVVGEEGRWEWLWIEGCCGEQGQNLSIKDSEFLDSDLDEYSAAPSPRSLMCCRIVAIIFMVLLVLRHTLPIVITGAEDYSATIITLLVLRTVGILLPIYVMVKAFTAIQRRRHQQLQRQMKRMSYRSWCHSRASFTFTNGSSFLSCNVR